MLVTFAEEVAPHAAGDTRLVPDTVAEQLRREGKLSASEPWPPMAPEQRPASAQKPARAVLKPTRPAGTPDQRKAV